MARHRLLVVEDEPINQRVIRVLFSAHDVEIDVVGTGAEALSFAKDKNYDLIMLDVGLPDMSGVDVALQLKANGVDSVLVALTAHVAPEQRKQCLEAGMVQYFTKPLSSKDVEDLLETLPELLKLARQTVC